VPVGGGTGVITRANITYVGCFGLYTGNDSHAMIDTQGGATGRIRPSDGKLVFLVTREASGAGDPMPIYEIEDPLSYSTNYQTAPRSANYPTAKYVGPVRGGVYNGAYMKSWFTTVVHDGPNTYNPGDNRPPSGGGWAMGAMFWNPDTNLLYSTYFDTYNTSGYADWGLIATDIGTLNPTTNVYENWTTYGPWRIRCTNGDGSNYYGPHRALFLGKHPTTGKMMCSSSLISGNVSSPWGPCLYSGADWPTASTPSGYGNPDIIMTDRYLDHYYMGGVISADGFVSGPLRSFRRPPPTYVFEQDGRVITLNVNPANYGGVGSWTEIDGSSFGVWLELTNTRGVLFFGNGVGAYTTDPTNRNAGHEWYQTAGSTCSHGHLPYLSAQGPVSTHSIPFLWIYDPDDLEAVKNTSLDYTPNPVDAIDLELEYPGFKTADMSTSGFKNIGSIYWDASRNYLFCLSLYADDFYPPGGGGALIHVFHIADVP
jgi:hypothetical protein